MADSLADLRRRVKKLESRVDELEKSRSALAPGLGERIRMTRNTARLTQHELAKKAGVSPNTIINIESGRTKPRLRTLLALAEALGVSYPYLQGVTDEH